MTTFDSTHLGQAVLRYSVSLHEVCLAERLEQLARDAAAICATIDRFATGHRTDLPTINRETQLDLLSVQDSISHAIVSLGERWAG